MRKMIPDITNLDKKIHKKIKSLTRQVLLEKVKCLQKNLSSMLNENIKQVYRENRSELPIQNANHLTMFKGVQNMYAGRT
uniref:Uncharacterized protein n=1 Tax=Rhizophora mucronata TaxID=61149 RepID=A0A2P2PKQ0_RHIMU